MDDASQVIAPPRPNDAEFFHSHVFPDGEAIKGRFMKKEKLDATTSGEKEVAATKEKNNDIQARKDLRAIVT